MTTTADILATSAVGLSLTALLGICLTLPMLFQKGANLKYDLMEGMNEFKGMTEDTWQRILAAKMGKDSKRQVSPYGHCH